jgi:hypothetical protein
MRQTLTLLQIYRAPVALAALSTAGLTSALLGDGFLNIIAWICFTGLTAVISRAWTGRQRPGK